MELVAEKYKQTEIGLIPNDWDVKKLSEIGESIIGLTYSPANVKPYGTLVLRSSNVQNGKLAFLDNVFVEMELPKRVIVRETDVLICVRNGSRQLIGKCALIDKKTAGCAFGAFMSIYRSEFSKFVFHQFQSYVIQKQINKTLGATINQITNKDLAAFQIPLPSSETEETAITTALSDADNYISCLEKLIAKKTLIKHGVMQQLLKPKEGWVVKKLNTVCENISSGKSKTQSVEGKFPIYGSTGVIGWSNNFDYIGNKILVARVGANAGTVNVVGGNYCVSDNTLMITLKSQAELKFIFYWLINFRLNQLVFGSGQPLITGGQLKNIEIAMPVTKEEQIQIATILSDIDAEITILEKQLAKAQGIKQGMMQQLLTGKIRLV
jgi:type I restriction enzyme, S subunit